MSTLESVPGRRLAAADQLARRLPFFYGWVMLSIATVANICTSPGQTYGVSTFHPSLTQSLGLSQSLLTGAYLVGTLLACLPQSWFGAFTDRHGIRWSMLVAATLLAAACMFASTVTNPFTLFLAFLLLRMFGQGMLALMANNTLAMWFDAKLGRAAALMSIGSAISLAVVPQINFWLIDQVGWRWAYVILGAAVWLLVAPLTVFLYRDRPEEVGQVRDGEPSREDAASPHATGEREPLPNRSAETNFTLAEAMGTRAYWILIGMTVLWSLVGTAIMFNIMPLLESRGVALEDRRNFYNLVALSLGVMQFAGGFLVDRFQANRLYFASLLTTSIALVLLLPQRVPGLHYAFPLLFGGSQGLFVVLSQAVWVRYYGRAHLGRIRGAMWTVAVAASSVGPFAMGLSMDLSGDYTVSIGIFLAMYAVMTVLSLGATPPPAPVRADEPGGAQPVGS